MAAGSDDTDAGDILWQVFCEDPDGGGAGPPAVPSTDRLAGEFDDTVGAGGTSIIFALDDANAAPAPQATAEAGIAYRVSLDTNNENDVPAGTDDCSPQHLFDENIKASLYVHVVGGGSTFDILKVNDASRGAVVV